MELPETDSEDEIPPGWEERCTTDGSVFYAHHESKSTQWTHPRTGKKKKVTGELPFGWLRQVSDDGKVVFVDHINNKTTYSDPRLAFAVEETSNVEELRQRYDSCSTGFQVAHGIDLTGKVAIVTGSNSGIGLETARTLTFHGCKVIFACRDMWKAQNCIAQLQKERPNSLCESMFLELSSLKCVNNFAREFATRFTHCDILVLNAGVFGIPFALTEDGLEYNFQVNFLSHFYLALLLQPLMTSDKSSISRVIFVSAEAHRFSNLNQEAKLIDILNPSSSSYLPTIAYNNSKLCTVLGSFELHRRFAELGLKCYAVHPGNVVCTGLSRHWWVYRVLFALVRPFAKSLIIIIGDLRGEILYKSLRRVLRGHMEYHHSADVDFPGLTKLVKIETSLMTHNHMWAVYVIFADLESSVRHYSDYYNETMVRRVEILDVDLAERKEDLEELCQALQMFPRVRVLLMSPNPVDFIQMFRYLNRDTIEPREITQDRPFRLGLIALNQEWDNFICAIRQVYGDLVRQTYPPTNLHFISYRKAFTEEDTVGHQLMISGLQEGLKAGGIPMLTPCGQYPADWVTAKISSKVIELLEHLDRKRDPQWLFMPGQIRPPRPEVAPENSKKRVEQYSQVDRIRRGVVIPKVRERAGVTSVREEEPEEKVKGPPEPEVKWSMRKGWYDASQSK